MIFNLEKEKFYLGSIIKSYLAYSSDENIRLNSASGGIVTTILLNLIKENVINGALVCRVITIDGKINYELKIVTDPDEILEFGGSIYFDVPILSMMEEIRQFKGTIAVVGLPCHLKGLQEFIQKDSVLSEKIALKIGLFCGHNSKKSLLLEILKQKKIREMDIHQLFFRRGHWRGFMKILLKSGRMIEFPFQDYSTYQNLHIDSLKKCLHCFDHTAEYSDISCGDAWIPSLKKNPIKHSVIISRTRIGNDILTNLHEKKVINITEIGPDIVYSSQKRSIINHKSIEARSKMGKYFGIPINCPEMYRNTSKWNHYLAACIVIMNVRLSENTRTRKIIFTIPKLFLYPYLFLFKILTSF